MEWFRMYNDARKDEKLKSLSDSQFRVWFRLMCFANEQKERGVIPIRSDKLLAVEVANGDVGLLKSTLDELSQLEIAKSENEAVHIINWNKRQFKSDESTNRWREWKNQQQTNVGQTLGQQPPNNHPTPPDTDTDNRKRNTKDPPSANASGVHIELGVTGGAQSSETGNGRKTAAEKPNEYTDEFEKFWTAYPRRKEKQKAFKVWRARLKDGVTPAELVAAAERYAMDCRKHQTEEKFIKFPATFLGPDRHYQDYAKPPDDRPKVAKDDPNYEEIQANRRMLGLGGT